MLKNFFKVAIRNLWRKKLFSAINIIGLSVGMILAWWREGLGGAITTACLVVFYAVHFATAGRLPAGWAWLLFAAPGPLFLACAWRPRPPGAAAC